MNTEVAPASRPAVTIGGWRDRRTVLLVAAAVLFVEVFVLRLTLGGVWTGVTFLFVVPIVLGAVGLGVRGGLISASVAVALFVAQALIRHVPLDPAGIGFRTVAFATLALAAGVAVESDLRAGRGGELTGTGPAKLYLAIFAADCAVWSYALLATARALG